MSKTFTGKNIDVALAKAAKATGVGVDDLNFEVLAGKTGGFALIKLKGGPVKKAGMVERLTGDGPSEGGGDDEPRRDDRDRRESRGRRDDRRGGRDDRRGGGRGRDRDRGGRGGRDRDRGDRGGRGDRREGRGRGGRGDRRGRPRQDPAQFVPEDGPTEVTTALKEDVEVTEGAQVALDTLAELLRLMGFGVRVELSEQDDFIRLDLVSEAYGEALVANDMELLDAMEHIVDKAVNTEPGSRRKIRIDANGAKAKADVDLGESAKSMAERAMEEGRTIKIGPLDPRSRRIVHMTLKEVEGVSTKSEGEGAFRRVCIIPKETKPAADEEAETAPDAE